MYRALPRLAGVSAELLADYADDRSHLGEPPAGSFSGAAGGAPCGDLVRISLAIEAGRIAAASFGAEGCAASRAAGAAVTDLVDGAGVLDAARLGPDAVAGALGGLGPQGSHAADLAADALHRALAAAASAGAALAPKPVRGERVLVAMSGGVDSAVAALLEHARGAEVACVTLKLWADQRTDGSKSCCSPQAVLGARALAHSMGLPHLTLDLTTPFRAQVVGAFITGYAAGETPNPCVICNGDLRLDAMVALPVAAKRESQDLCFLAGEGKRSFLARHGGLREHSGELVDSAGRIVGRHRGHHQFTIGQRRGLGVAASQPLYVTATDAHANRVVVGPREELATRRVQLRDATLHRPAGRIDRVKLRYRSRPIPCAADPLPAGAHRQLDLRLAEPAYGVAPGQTACLMAGDLIVGRATIAG